MPLGFCNSRRSLPSDSELNISKLELIGEGRALLPRNGDGTRGNSLKLCQESFRWIIRKDFFLEKAVRPWKGGLEVSREGLNVALSAPGWAHQPHELGGLFQAQSWDLSTAPFKGSSARPLTGHCIKQDGSLAWCQRSQGSFYVAEYTQHP